MATYNGSVVLLSKGKCDFLEDIKYACKESEIYLQYERDFYNFIKMVTHSSPDIIFVDGLSMSVEKFPFQILNNDIFKETIKIAIISNNFKCENKLLDVIPVGGINNYIVKKMNEKFGRNRKVVSRNYNNQINSCLAEFCISPKHIGKEYLKECINIVLTNKEASRNLTRDCYAIVAMTHNTNIQNIERDIRNAIKTAFENNKAQKISLNWMGDKKIPSNRSFIFYIAERVLEKMI